MDAAAFEQALARYPIVRPRDYVAPTPPRRASSTLLGALGGAAPTASPSAARGAASVGAAAPASKGRAAAPASKGAAPAAMGAATMAAMSAAADAAAASVAASAAAAEVTEFWGGLDALLAAHFTKPEVLKRIAQRFDERHYAALRSMNYEDVDDLAAMMTRELAEGRGRG